MTHRPLFMKSVAELMLESKTFLCRQNMSKWQIMMTYLCMLYMNDTAMQMEEVIIWLQKKWKPTFLQEVFKSCRLPGETLNPSYFKENAAYCLYYIMIKLKQTAFPNCNRNMVNSNLNLCTRLQTGAIKIDQRACQVSVQLTEVYPEESK